MYVELKGIGFTNKGAELMCLAIMEQLDQALPEPRYVFDPLSNYELRKEYPLYTKFWMHIKGFQMAFLGRLIPKKFRNRFGIVLDEEIDLIIEASGFAYGDKWGNRKAQERLGRYIARWKKQGKKIILLPQAFGPFTDSSLRKTMQHILRYADLVYARDSQSLEYLQELAQEAGLTTDSDATSPTANFTEKNHSATNSPKSNLRLAPDFTNLLHGELPIDFEPEKHRIAVIPNEKMLQMTTAEYGQAYQDRLVDILSWLEEQGRAPYILIHEGEGDIRLGRELIRRTGLDIPLLHYSSPLYLKGILATAELVITSRFHGAVSALSQGIPTAVYGWSHKYQMLLQDYQCEHMLLDAEDPDSLKLLQKAADEIALKELRTTLLAAAHKEKKRARAMWEDVLRVIQG